MQILTKIVESHFFNNFILVVVLINSVVLGLQTSPDIMNATHGVLNVVDKVCLWIFVAECIMKLIVYKHRYFCSGWNWFDFLVVAASLISDFGALSSMRAFRIVRVFRALKFISGIKNLQVIVSAIGKSIPRIGWTALLMMLVYYIFAIIGTIMFGDAFPAWFGSIGKSMYSLFQIMTLESWSMGIARPVMDVYPYAWCFFVPFVVMSSFVILNIVVGIVVNSIGEVSEARAGKEADDQDAVDVEKEIALIEEHLRILKESVRKK